MRIIIPIVNSFSSEVVFPIVLDESTAISIISQDDYYILHSFLETKEEDFSKLIKSTSVCVTIENAGKNINYEDIKRAAVKLQFLFNYFLKDNPIYFVVGLGISDDNKIIESIFFDLPSDYLSLSKKEYSTSTDVEFVIEFYKQLISSLKKFTSLYFTLQKFNDTHYRQNELEKYVDLTVAYESMIPGASELRYRFITIHSILSEPSPENRLEAYCLLDALYNARSGIVHGDIDGKERKRDIAKVRDNYRLLYIKLRSVLFYYITFLSSTRKDGWKKHLIGLAIGSETRKF